MTKKYDEIRTLCLALFCKGLNKNQICPGNHVLDYDQGWFYIDGKTIERDWARRMHTEAVELHSKGFRGKMCHYPNRNGWGAPYWVIDEESGCFE